MMSGMRHQSRKALRAARARNSARRGRRFRHCVGALTFQNKQLKKQKKMFLSFDKYIEESESSKDHTYSGVVSGAARVTGVAWPYVGWTDPGL